MPNRTIDRSFEDYLDTGCPRALSEVFDLAAPPLLRVGAAAGLDRPSSEDALQECFLVIVRRRDTYVRGRSFMPWASGIMARQAKDASRRLRRERELVAQFTRELGSRPTPVGTSIGPESLAPEASEALARALKPLPQEQREVLELRFIEGLDPAEIGLRLGIRPNAVSARITRGTRRLRQTLSGASLAALAGVLLARPARGLDAVCRVVVAESSKEPFAPAGGTSGLAAAGAAALAAAVALGGALWLAAAREPVTAADAPTRGAEADRAPGGLRVATLDDVSARVLEESKGTAVDGAGDRIAGTIVSLAGDPVEGVAVFALTFNEYLRLPDGPPTPAATSGPGGSFAFALDEQDDRTPLLYARAEGVAGYCRVDSVRTGLKIRLAPSKSIAVTVVDEQGQPLQGASLAAFPFVEAFISPSGDSADACTAVEPRRYQHLFGATTDAAGRARVEALPAMYGADTFGVLGIECQGFVASSRIVRWLQGTQVVEENVRLVPAHPVALVGRVTDESGEPLSGAVIEVAGGSDASDQALQVVADKVGAFSVPGLRPSHFPTTVTCVRDGYEAHRRYVRRRDVESGSLRFDIALRPLVQRHGRVVDGSGAGIAGVQVRCTTTEYSERLVSGPDGAFTVDTGLGRALAVTARVPHGVGDACAGMTCTQRVPADTTDFSIVVDAPSEQAGEVVFSFFDAETGDPADVLRAGLSSDLGAAWEPLELDGHRVIARGLPAGKWTVFACTAAAESPEQRLLAQQSVELAAGDAADVSVDVWNPGYIEVDVSALQARGFDKLGLFASSQESRNAPLWFYAGEATCETAQRSAVPKEGSLRLGPLTIGTYTLGGEGGATLDDGSCIEPTLVEITGPGTVRAKLLPCPSGNLNFEAGASAVECRLDLAVRKVPDGDWLVATRFVVRPHLSRTLVQCLPVGAYEWRCHEFVRSAGDLHEVEYPPLEGTFEIQAGGVTNLAIGHADAPVSGDGQ